jgi:hypothetical protein
MKRLSYSQILRAYNDYQLQEITKKSIQQSVEWRRLLEFLLFLEAYMM